MGMSDYDIAIAGYQFQILELTNEIKELQYSNIALENRFNLCKKMVESLTDELNLAHEALRRAMK